MNSGLMLISECIFAHGKSASLAFHYFVFMSFLLDFRVCCTQVFLFDVKSNHLNKREITDMFSSFAKTVIQKTVENFFLKMEETGREVICDAPPTFTFKRSVKVKVKRLVLLCNYLKSFGAS